MIKTFICRICAKQVTEDRSLFVMRYVCNACTRKMEDLDEDVDVAAYDAMPIAIVLPVIEEAVDAVSDTLDIQPETTLPDTTPSYDPSPEVSDPGTSFDY